MTTAMGPAGLAAARRFAARPVLHLIDGRWEESTSGETFPVYNPATGEVLTHAAAGGSAEIDRAVQAARRALAGPWGQMSAAERARILEAVARRVMAHKEELAYLETLDMGRPIKETAHGYIERVCHNFEFFARYAEQLEAQAFTNHQNYMFYVLREPVGVVGLITPWNFPLMLATWKIAPTLAAGNTCILKPAELTPLTATRLGELAMEAGLPPGVLNIVHGFGPSAAGEELTRHPGVNALSFTGETATGKAIYRNCASSLKKLSFELGGKGATLIFDDADLETAVRVADRAAFLNQGQVCLAGSRIYVQQGIYERFLERFVQRVRSLKVGDPLDPATEMGSLIGEEHCAKVTSYVAIGRSEKARLVTGGNRVAHLPGWFLEPTVFADADPGCRICNEEIFGPVVTVTPFRTEDEVVAWANATPYGLSASIITTKLATAHRMARRLQFGNIWINSWFVRDLRVPFGGMKQSGIGREGGIHSFDFYTEQKTVGLPVE